MRIRLSRVEELIVPAKGIILFVMLTALVSAASSHAQQSPDERARTSRQQDGRYLIYMRGIT